MSFKIVFCLTTNGSDAFFRMHSLAVRSVQYYMPKAQIITLVDLESANKITKSGIASCGRPLGMRVIETASGPDGFRNRWMKTKLRELVSGDVLYLDSDLVLRAGIQELWAYQGDLMGVLDRNQTSPYFAPFDRDRYKAAGWPLPSHGSINGGVLFWRDSKAAHNLSAAYHSRWLESYQRTGKPMDQQALNTAIDDCNVELMILPSTYNSMERYHPSDIGEAKIWHFIFSNVRLSGDHKSWTKWESIVRGESAEPHPMEWSRWRHPWIVRDPLAWMFMHALKRSAKVNYIQDFRRIWLLGDRVGSLKSLLRK